MCINKGLIMLYRTAIRYALNRFIKEDCYLIEHDVNERSQTHKIAEYLQVFFSCYNTDCEYNKNLDDHKELDFSDIVTSIRDFIGHRRSNSTLINYDDLYNALEALEAEMREAVPVGMGAEGEDEYLLVIRQGASQKKYIRRVFPDIIVHCRGTNINNKIVIEAKKHSNKDAVARLFDRIKLGLFTKKGGKYKYDIGFFIDIPDRISSTAKIRFEKDKLVKGSNVFLVTIS